MAATRRRPPHRLVVENGERTAGKRGNRGVFDSEMQRRYPRHAIAALEISSPSTPDLLQIDDEGRLPDLAT